VGAHLFSLANMRPPPNLPPAGGGICSFVIIIAILASLYPCAAMAQSSVASEPATVQPDAAASDAATVEKPLPEAENPQISNSVVLQGLNKVTGHTSKIEGPIGATQRFGNLEIIPRRCWKSSPEDRPEDAVLLEIRELQIGEESKRIFLGWMFSSSPGLSGLEHPVYDVSVLSCEFQADPEHNAASSAAAASSPADATNAKPAKKTAKVKKKPVSQ